MLDSRRVFFLAAGAILFYQLILPPVVGLADNGDFAKVIGRFNLHGRVSKTYGYTDNVYTIRPENHWVSGFVSTEIPLAQLAVWLNALISKDGNFDLRCIGVVHGVLFLFAVWLFVPLLAGVDRGVRWIVCAFVLFMYCDMMYVNSLNSFYMDEPSYLFLLLTVVAFLRVIQFGRRLDAILLMICPFLAVAAKTQHALLGFWIALLLFATASVLKPIRRGGWYMTAICLVLASVLMIWKAQPADYAGYPLYNVTFDGLLPHSQNAGRTMADLGLEDSYRTYIGKKAFVAGSGMDDRGFRERFMRRLSYGKLAVFYARHPATAFHTMIDSLSEQGRQHAFGNFDISAGYPPAESKAFALWSDVKSHLFYRHGLAFLLTFLSLVTLFAVLLLLEHKSLPRGVLTAGFCLIGAGLTELGLSTLCDSMDLTRHALVFFALFDMIALACVYLALSSILRKTNWRTVAAVLARFDFPVLPDIGEIPERARPQAETPPPVPQPASTPRANPPAPPARVPTRAPAQTPPDPLYPASRPSSCPPSAHCCPVSSLAGCWISRDVAAVTAA